MKNLKITLLMIAAIICGMSVSAQNPYPQENDPDAYSWSLKFSGERPSIKDFVNSFIEEPEDEHMNFLYTVWNNYLKNKPQEPENTITVDTKNGYICIESLREEEYETEGTTEILTDRHINEFCYWNCADGKHKIFCTTTFNYRNGEPFTGQYDGIEFYVYNNATRKMTLISNEDMGVVVNTENAEVTYTLPRVGKNLKATIYKTNGSSQEKIFTWTGYKFK